MLEKDFPPRKDHIATAKMLDIYYDSAIAQVELLKSLGNSKPQYDEKQAYEITLRLNLARAWKDEISRIRFEYYKKLKNIAVLYMDIELEVFSYAIINKESPEKVSEKTGLSIETINQMIEGFEKDLDSISLI